MSSSRLPPDQRRPTSVAEAADRLAAIVEAAERAASTVIDEAEQLAQAKVEEAQVRADRVVAERLRALADQLDPPSGRGEPPFEALAEVDVAPEPEPEPEPEVSEVAQLPPVLRSVAGGEQDEPIPMRRSNSSAARLMATQMAVSGASREEIETKLRNGFEIDDASQIVDAILGPEV